MTKKYEVFIGELRAFLRSHGVQLSSSGYDRLQAWDLFPGDDPIYNDAIEDRTDGVEMPNSQPVTGKERIRKLEKMLDRAADTLHECGLRDEIHALLATTEKGETQCRSTS